MPSFCLRSLVCQIGSVQLALTTTYSNAGKKASTGDEINYVYTVTNNGLLTLYDIKIQADSLHEEEFAIDCVNTNNLLVRGSNVATLSGLAAYPDKGLAPAASLRCTATGVITQAEVIRMVGVRAAILFSSNTTKIILESCNPGTLGTTQGSRI